MLSNTVKTVKLVTLGVFLGSSSFANLMTPDELGMSSKVVAAPYALSKAGLEKVSLSASPEHIARSFLQSAAAKLGLKSDLSDVRLVSVTAGPAGITVRFEQIVNGIAVDSADLVVTVSQGEVVTLISNYAKLQDRGLEKVASTPKASLSKEWAMQKAYSELNLTASPTFQEIKEKISVIDGQARPVYVIGLSAPIDHKYGWEFVIDADSGAILRSRDTSFHKGPGITTAVFDPNPTLKSGHIYGSVPGYLDDNHGDSDFFKSMLTQISLDNLTVKAGKTILTGPNVQMADFEAPSNPNCDVDVNQKSWSYTRGNPCFDDVSAYYFIDKTLKYLNGTLGFNAHPRKYTGGVKVDAHGVNGDDNSHYVETTDVLAFGEGGVPDAQDHDVVIHELGHAIHSWLTNGNISQVEGLSEGCGDYWAASYDRQFSKPGQVYRDWTFSYDGHNPFWPGRDVAKTGKYPTAAQGEIHDAGTLWATACIEIYDAIGKQKADKAFWSAIAMLTRNSSQNDAAKAYVAAARKLYATDTNLIDTVIAKFQARGYTVK